MCQRHTDHVTKGDKRHKKDDDDDDHEKTNISPQYTT